ncbi:MAG TPA: peptidoglycan-binding protein [Acidimicrobiales bacterium]|nr:peptidoglycan-binding protein [Acidimicrobiales bacterium]
MLRGDDVAELQRRLGELGFDAGRVDGIFGDHTATALADFQRNLDLTVDGICGPATVEALTRLTPRTGGGSVAEVRERDRLRRGAPGLTGRRVAVGHPGGLPALVDAVVRELSRAGADAVSLTDPDGSAQAAQANAVEVDAYIGFHLDPGRQGCAAAYYSGFRYESPGGKRLAELLAAALAATLGLPDLGAQGMSLPVLRETRMPAVVCEIGPPAAVVEGMARLGPAVARALRDWAAAPCEE